jgi:hypothetical protein
MRRAAWIGSVSSVGIGLIAILVVWLSPRSRLNEVDDVCFQAIAKDLATARLVVHEGLPHQESEPELLALELATQETLRIEAFPFYAKPVRLPAESVETVRRYCLSPRTFCSRNTGAPKACLGFHPDYCLIWTNGPRTHRFLLCLGCGDAVIVGANPRLNLEFAGDHGDFGQFLWTLREQRPKPAWIP